MEAFLGGFLAKVYDDFTDNHMISPLGQELLKGAQWMLLTLLSYNDFNFACSLYITQLLTAFADPDQFNQPYESSLLILSVCMVFYSFSTAKYLSLYDLGYIGCFMLVLFIEPLFIKEEFSERKFLLRTMYAINAFIGLCIAPYFDISPSLIKVGFYGLGYTSCSSMFQAYLLTSSTSI